MSLLSAPLVVLDTETTGFPKQEWSRVIELAAVLLDRDGKEVSSWSSLIKPDVLDERADGALAVNHITREMLEGQPDTGSAAMSFLAWLSSHGLPKVTAFNVGFDCSMLKKMGLQVEWAPCVMLAAQKAMGVDGWPKLSAAAEHFNVPVEGDAHRALTDARTAARIVVAIQSKAKGLPMPVYDIIDQPGPLPGEKPEAAPAAVDALIATYDVCVLGYEDGTIPVARVNHGGWSMVVNEAHADDKLRAVSAKITDGRLVLAAVVDVGDSSVTVSATADTSISTTILDLVDL